MVWVGWGIFAVMVALVIIMHKRIHPKKCNGNHFPGPQNPKLPPKKNGQRQKK